jgi:hypothetical protein
LLRASGQPTERTFDLRGVFDDASGVGVDHAIELIRFADAAVIRDAEATRRARKAVIAAMGEAAMIDAAAVIGGFDGITRVTDATGLPIEPQKAELTADLRTELELDRKFSAGDCRRARSD